MNLKNLPVQKAALLGALIDVKPGQVTSMSLASGEGVAITLLAFAPGESVSEEEYFGDTFYYVVEGKAEIAYDGLRFPMVAGDVLKVPAHTDHAVENIGVAFKLLQITVQE